MSHHHNHGQNNNQNQNSNYNKPKEMPVKASTGASAGTLVVSIIIALIIGFLAGVWYERRAYLALDTQSYNQDSSGSAIDNDTIAGDQTAKTGDKAGEMSNYASTDEYANLTVVNQPAGDSVNISSVNVGDTTWIAVREDNNGELGNILGARLVYQGSTDDVSVELLRATEPGKIYHVVLYKDDGDRLFDQKLDSLVQKDGTTLTATFLTNSN